MINVTLHYMGTHDNGDDGVVSEADATYYTVLAMHNHDGSQLNEELHESDHTTLTDARNKALEVCAQCDVETFEEISE